MGGVTEWVMVPREPTPEILAAAAIAVWPVASLSDVELATRAADIVLRESMDLAKGATREMLAASIATMAPGYRAMLAAAPSPPAEAQVVSGDAVEALRQSLAILRQDSAPSSARDAAVAKADTAIAALSAQRCTCPSGDGGDALVEAIIERVGRENSADGMDGDSWDRLLVRAALSAQPQPERDEEGAKWRPMATAPRDGTMVRLLVEFTDHSTEDADTAPTIGACNDDNLPESECVGWQFAGWCWSHDQFAEGRGTPLGWLPMLDTVSQPASAPVGVEGWRMVPVEPTWDMRNEGREFLIDGLEKNPEKLAYFLWKTMLAAAPEVP